MCACLWPASFFATARGLAHSPRFRSPSPPPAAIVNAFQASGAPDQGRVLAPESPLHEIPYPEFDEKLDDKKVDAEVGWGSAAVSIDDSDGRMPTDEERKTLRLVPASLPKTAYLICLIEFAERASCASIDLTVCALSVHDADSLSPLSQITAACQ
jgi:hypothetical protein